MPRFESSRGRDRGNRSSRGDAPRRDNRRSGRDSSRGYGRDRPAPQMTKVICSSCNSECEVPFKPTSNKPIYCSDCFAKNGGGRSNARPNRSSSPNNSKEFEAINEKLDKIMKALNIEQE